MIDQLTALKQENASLKQDNSVKTILIEKELSLVKVSMNEKIDLIKDEWSLIKSDVNSNHRMITEGIDRLKLEYSISEKKVMMKGIESTILFRTFWKQLRDTVVTRKIDIHSTNNFFCITKLIRCLIDKFDLKVNPMTKKYDGIKVYSKETENVPNKFDYDSRLDNELLYTCCFTKKTLWRDHYGDNSFRTYHIVDELLSIMPDIITKTLIIKEKLESINNIPIKWYLSSLSKEIIDDYDKNVKPHILLPVFSGYNKHQPTQFTDFINKYNINAGFCDYTKFKAKILTHGFNLYFIDKHSFFFIDENMEIQPYLF
jgi:hypothetical protein